jgi:tetratricopeptide (TPR) repeat protein
MTGSRIGMLAGVVAVLAGMGQAPDARLALRDDLTGFHRPITTASPEAQKYFDQGITLYYGFHHEAAIASFREAASLDPSCAMAWWGQAVSAGPNINNPFMDSTASRNAWEAVRHAGELASRATPLERDLISALSHRYAWPPPQDRKALDSAYAAAMRGVWQRHPDDADAGALFADAMMNLRPWDLWTPAGEPQPGTPEIVATLERVIAMDPRHPGANHFYVHTMEGSPTPGKALAAANVLRDRIPGAGHLVHMPAHIDIRVGHYADAIRANQRAIAVDSTWERGGFYTMYRAHNFHFLAYAAMFDGQRATALRAARDMVAQVPLEVVRQFPDAIEGFLGIPVHVLVRFGLWDEMLAEPRPEADLLATTAFWRYGRTVALAATGRVDEAGVELDSLRAAIARVPETRMIGNNSARTVLAVGLPMAEGEVEYRRGNSAKAFALLRTAVDHDDALRYDEPWGWMMPVRHALGALLLEDGRANEAEAVYRRDLEVHPGNGWALRGLAECLADGGKEEEADSVEALFREAWKRSDIAITASCFCRPGAGHGGHTKPGEE